MSERSVRGAGRARGGALDTTMLIWKVIAANPGITRSGIWEQVEHSIPEGYALRCYAAENRKRGIPITDTSVMGIAKARSFILTLTLGRMRRNPSTVAWDGDGRDRRYVVTREPEYYGNPDAVDETGTKAAEHMALADALRIAEKWLARAKPDRVDRNGRRSVILGPPSRKECEALMLIVKALRAKGPA